MHKSNLLRAHLKHSHTHTKKHAIINSMWESFHNVYMHQITMCTLYITVLFINYSSKKQKNKVKYGEIFEKETTPESLSSFLALLTVPFQGRNHGKSHILCLDLDRGQHLEVVQLLPPGHGYWSARIPGFTRKEFMSS